MDENAGSVEGENSAGESSAPAMVQAFPETALGYEVRLSSDFQFPEGYSIEDGQSPINIDDPRVAAARDFAHANKMTQAQFEAMLGMGLQHELAEEGRLREALTQEVEKLGAKGKERINEIKTWVASKLPADEAEALLGTLYSAKQIQAMERLMKLNRGAVPGNPGAGRDTGRADLSDEEWDKMSPGDRILYAREHTTRR